MIPSLVAVAAGLGPRLLARLGEGLGYAWMVYGMLLFLITFWGLTALIFVFFAYLSARRRVAGRLMRRVSFPCELLFCLANPLAYLLILVHSSGDQQFFTDVRPTWLDPLAWLILGLLWGLRLVPVADLERRRQWARALLVVGMGLLAAYTLKDWSTALVGSPEARSYPLQNPFYIFYLFGVLALYLTPAAILVRFLRSSWSPERWRDEHGFVILPPRVGGAIVLTLLALALLSLGLFESRSSDAQVEALVRSRQGAILRAARKTGTDPQLLAALVFVLQRRQVSRFGSALEASLTEACLVDPTGGTLISDSLDLSIGLAQIKPITAQTALLVLQNAIGSSSYYYKEYREVPRLGPSWQFDSAEVADLQAVTAGWFPGKREVVTRLLDDEAALEMSALILELYARQWERADPAWSIRRRPEILATLYPLGFERSEPKPDPRSNAFGRAVRAAMARFD